MSRRAFAAIRVGNGVNSNILPVAYNVLKLQVVNTHTALLVDGVVVVRRQGDGPGEKAVDVWTAVFQWTRGPGHDQTGREGGGCLERTLIDERQSDRMVVPREKKTVINLMHQQNNRVGRRDRYPWRRKKTKRSGRNVVQV